MISNQILQNTIDGLREITRVDLCVLDMEGQVLASTEQEPEDSDSEVAAFIASPADSQVVHGYQFLKYLTRTSWNIFCWQRGPAMMYIWWERWRLSSFPAF